MGGVKDNMQPTAPANNKGGVSGALGRLAGRRDKKTDPAPAETFVDMISLADDRLNQLITQKQTELRTEGALQEPYNRKALAMLETMSFHMDKIIEAAQAYQDIKK